MSEWPTLWESKAICFPSGDHFGVPVEGALNEVSCTGFEASLADIQISSLPVRSEAKAIFFPSGEKSISNCVRVEEINLVGALRGPDQCGPAVRQTFKFTLLRR